MLKCVKFCLFICSIFVEWGFFGNNVGYLFYFRGLYTLINLRVIMLINILSIGDTLILSERSKPGINEVTKPSTAILQK
ncbi:hypothetical protein GCM10007216_15450 [Thalassobacillus devorans]|uniref:Uncharacterized protein n=1 Tax=Thalassobacillus devorans TaxID=279813 RepID=A0ABQ1NVD0_9BACI|nr:hypothetical protein GCM10007216_15450 [Thalassobacillus devorans]